MIINRRGLFLSLFPYCCIAVIERQTMKHSTQLGKGTPIPIGCDLPEIRKGTQGGLADLKCLFEGYFLPTFCSAYLLLL